MFQKATYNKLLIAFALAVVANLAMASFTTSSGDKNKFSLKTLANISKKFSLTLLNTKDFQFRGLEDLNKQKDNSGIEINSMVKLQKGNTTYVYPYKYVIKLPKFKTPTPSTTLP